MSNCVGKAQSNPGRFVDDMEPPQAWSVVFLKDLNQSQIIKCDRTLFLELGYRGEVNGEGVC